ncbi:hypothetical protein DVH24_022089 [Malus domestica]|uniref:Uncharacterized protein n=1 Tax=Malus domestica TaxID=3750 RepID=A0A498IU73_MALDO|nr:hypothetical protein DVH24_022089 [Malus domestica]
MEIANIHKVRKRPSDQGNFEKLSQHRFSSTHTNIPNKSSNRLHSLIRIDETMKQFQKSLIELETEAEHLLLARNQAV